MLVSLALLANCSVSPFSAEEPGGKLAFVRGDGNDTDIYMYDFGSGQVVDITQSSDFEYFPSISQDGGQIAFVRSRGDAFDPEIFLLDLTANETTNVNPKDLFAFHPDWSPDGKSLAIQTGKGVYILNVGTKEVAELTPGEVSQRAIWRPGDGSLAVGMGDFDIYLVNVKTGDRKVLVSNFETASFPLDWSPDGRFLLYSSAALADPEKLERIYILDTETSESQPLFEDEAISFSYQKADATWSPDGTWIAFEFIEEICIVDLNGDWWGCIGEGNEPDWGP